MIKINRKNKGKAGGFEYPKLGLLNKHLSYNKASHLQPLRGLDFASLAGAGGVMRFKSEMIFI